MCKAREINIETTELQRPTFHLFVMHEIYMLFLHVIYNFTFFYFLDKVFKTTDQFVEYTFYYVIT